MAPFAASKRQWLPLPRWRSCLACQPGRRWRRKRPARRRGATCSGMYRQGTGNAAGHGAPRGGAAAEAAPVRGPFSRARQAGQGAAGLSPERQARPAGCARTAAHAAAVGLPAGADGRHRDCAQHPRHQGRRRLRGRGSGAAGGDRAAGQAAGFGEAGGDPALSHGVCAGRVDPQRYRAAGGAPRQRRLRSRQFRLVRVPRPQPHRRRQALRARPRQRARRSRLQVRRRQLDLADRPHRAAGIARERAAFRLHAVLDRAGPGLGLVPRGPYPSRPDGTAQQLPDLPVGRVGSAAAESAAIAGRAARGSAAARSRRQAGRRQVWCKRCQV